MSLYDRKLLGGVTMEVMIRPGRDPRIAAAVEQAAYAQWKPRCPGCLMPTRTETFARGHTAAGVWAMLDENRCPACNALLVLRDREPLVYKCAIARRLLGLAPGVGGARRR